MKKMDEMDRNIYMRSEEWGYKVSLLSLCIWTIFNLYQSIVNKIKLDMLPCLILCLSIFVQSIAQIIIKQKMIAGDEEYKEPNRVLQLIITLIAFVVVILSIGAYFFLKV